MNMESSWSKLKVLGAGSYGTVSLAASNDSLAPKVAAVKSAECHVHYAVDSLKAEARFLAELNRAPNVVQCFGEDISVEDGDRVVYNLFLEYAAGGSLHELIKNTHNNCGGGSTMSETQVACYASMLLTGLEGIHSRGIVHCDLKPANVLVFPVPGGISQLKIADFGLARRVTDKEEVRSNGRNNYNRGTPLYSSPESVACGLHGTSADIWSFGCIMIEMITGKHVWSFRDMKDLSHQILHRGVRIPPNLSKEGIDFLMRCLVKDPQKRWSAKKLLDHPFIVKNLNIMSEVHGIDLNKGEELFQRRPFGDSGWVSKRHLFSKWVWEAEQQQRQQQYFQPYNLFPVQQTHQLFQFPCGAALVDLIK